MNAPVQARATCVPPGTQISLHLPGAHFADCFEIAISADAPCALALYLQAAANTPAWVNTLMAARNRVVHGFGLKNLGALNAVDPAKPVAAYRVGDRIGIFSLLYLSDDEVVLSDCDKHLQVWVSVSKQHQNARPSAAVATVVHIHNTLGRLYMALITPVHRLIAPAMLARAVPFKSTLAS
jgi:hypothetical protein